MKLKEGRRKGEDKGTNQQVEKGKDYLDKINCQLSMNAKAFGLKVKNITK